MRELNNRKPSERGRLCNIYVGDKEFLEIITNHDFHKYAHVLPNGDITLFSPHVFLIRVMSDSYLDINFSRDLQR